MYGTLEGTIGQLIQIPKTTYLFLKRLCDFMEQSVRSISRIPLKDHRLVRVDQTISDHPKNILDGDYLEQFLEFDEQL